MSKKNISWLNILETAQEHGRQVTITTLKQMSAATYRKLLSLWKQKKTNHIMSSEYMEQQRLILKLESYSDEDIAPAILHELTKAAQSMKPTMVEPDQILEVSQA